MKLTTVIGSVNNNPKYYMFIPKQILFWGEVRHTLFCSVCWKSPTT